MLWTFYGTVTLKCQQLKLEKPLMKNIYTIQQALRHLLEVHFIEVYDIAFNNKSLTRKYKPLVSQAEYVDSFINNDTRLQLASNFVNNTDDLEELEKLQKLIEKKLRALK